MKLAGLDNDRAVYLRGALSTPLPNINRSVPLLAGSDEAQPRAEGAGAPRTRLAPRAPARNILPPLFT